MNIPSLLFLGVAGMLILFLPRRAASVPLLLAAVYTTRLPIVEIGPANLSVLRVLVLFGFVRILLRGEKITNGINDVDRWLAGWAFVLIGMSVFHTSDAWTFRLGMLLGEVGVYVLFRVFIQSADDLRYVFALTCVTLLPLAILLLLEKSAARNFFAVMGVTSEANIRENHVRATGPFAHAILTGTVGAMCVPMALCLWRTHRKSAMLGICAGLGILFAATSSGPIMMLAYVIFALIMWNFRGYLRPLRWAVVLGVVALQIVMNDPVYFLMARIDITGGSTGYYRSQLIRSALEHFNEWWAVGTDYTRHWMATGTHANAIHSDIVNHFLAMGVLGGLPLMLIFLLMLRAAFREVGLAVRNSEGESSSRRFIVWTVGAMLFGQVMSFWAISPYDQSVSLLYLIFAGIGAVRVPQAVAVPQAVVPLTRSVRSTRNPLLTPGVIRNGAIATMSPASQRMSWTGFKSPTRGR